ncbi:hypothetical protein INQ28_26445, partial [Escherichia coli]|nr:hypothetical protein [Escherichia coli]
SFRRVDINFPNRQVRFLMPVDRSPKERATGSMIPGVSGSSPLNRY